ncbi:hypothetical protein V3F56_07615 [Moorellaceae bacterium AZ2]
MQVSVNLEELRQRLAAAAAEGKTNLAALLREMGISPDNPAAVQQLLMEAGLKPEEMGDKEKLAQFVNQMTQSFTPEMKKNIAAFYHQLAKDMGSEIPEDLQRFLADWQKG